MSVQATRPIGRGFLAGVALLLVALGGASRPHPPAPRTSPWQGWTTLRLKAKSSLLVRGTVELRRSREGDTARLETATSASFIGATLVRSSTRTDYDTEGRTREHVAYTTKKGRRFRFGEHAYTVEKLVPVAGEAPWQVESTKEFDYPHEGEVAIRPSDYYSMLLCLERHELDTPGDEVVLYVAALKGPRSYRIRVQEERTTERAFTDLASGRTTRRPTREIRLSVVPTDPQEAEGFLGMQGEAEIWVEAETKTPLEISGKVPRVPGKVRLVLAALG